MVKRVYNNNIEQMLWTYSRS